MQTGCRQAADNCRLAACALENPHNPGSRLKDLKLFENFAWQSPEKNLRGCGADARDLTLDAFNIPMNAISAWVQFQISSKRLCAS